MLSEAAAFHFVTLAQSSGIFHLDYFEECVTEISQCADAVGLPSKLHHCVLGQSAAFHKRPGVFARLDGGVGGRELFDVPESYKAADFSGRQGQGSCRCPQ